MSALDPATMLWTGGVVSGMPDPIVRGFYENELFQDDFLKTRRARPPGAARQVAGPATGGVLHRSKRFREDYEPHGMADELRVVFAADGAAWGQACLPRDAAQPHFTQAEIAFVASLSKHLAHALSVAPVTAEQPEAARAGRPRGPRRRRRGEGTPR